MFVLMGTRHLSIRFIIHFPLITGYGVYMSNYNYVVMGIFLCTCVDFHVCVLGSVHGCPAAKTAGSEAEL